jgi:hypothetical protein
MFKVDNTDGDVYDFSDLFGKTFKYYIKYFSRNLNYISSQSRA